MHKALSRYQWLPEKVGSCKGTVGGQRYLCSRPLGIPTLVTKGCLILHSHSIGQRTHFWHCWYFLCKTYLLTYKAKIPVGLPCSSNGKESACSAGDQGSFSGWGRSLEKGMAIHSSILAWRGRGATVHGSCKELDITKQLLHTHTHTERHKQLIYHCILLKNPRALRLVCRTILKVAFSMLAILIV